MTKWIKWILVLLIMIALYYWLSKPEVLTVSIINADIGKVEQTISNTRAGTVTSCQRAKMSFPIGGQIKSISVEEGQLVTENQLLLALWNDDVKAKLAESEALLTVSQRTKDSACIIAKNARKAAKRQQSLLKQNLTSQENLDAANANAESTQANCRALTAQILANEEMVNVVQATLEKTYLKAPFSGIVAEITGEVGEYTTPSPPGVATPPAIDLLTHDCHYVTAPIDEVDAGSLIIGKPVKITMDAHRNQIFEGKLRRISPYVQDYEKQARTVSIEVDFIDNEAVRLLSGYSADVEVILDSAKQTLRLPSDLIINNETVLVLNDQNLIEERKVRVGLNNWQFSQILEGITLTDRVISSIGQAGVVAGNEAVAISNKNQSSK
ncbi:efflux RND transporter periplasmic adaptor subunit [Candidatus Colwellia aromaticivorans]|uniref:efflux RND transporter periplasmic adaptor subunit n=1 Tax=Candidatus Colwellia aromaticivorans TaxID=2267621 RepID=UPI000DF36E9E|nr:efflux RND transporter periplasmic adaptor subunit [Candidatus Colwellia aromaticivorans]